jgi:probable phosphoglycerate mutase
MGITTGIITAAATIMDTEDMVDDTTKGTTQVQIFLCRHGETQWTIEGRHTSFSDIPLTDKGRVQAVMLGKRLRDISFNQIIVSPMLRTQETCQMAGIIHHKTLEPLAMEWNYGEYEGITSPQIWEKKPRWNIFDDGAPGGESPDEVAARADSLLKPFLHASGNILIFSHGHFSRVLAARWLGLEVQAGKYFALSVASLSALGYEHDQRVIKMWNDTAHL